MADEGLLVSGDRDADVMDPFVGVKLYAKRRVERSTVPDCAVVK